MNANFEHLLGRGVAEVIVLEEMRQKLRAGRPLRLKLGFDPSKPDLHIGHAVILRKIRQFQDLGHQVILIVGDWTAQIGDPSGRDESRHMLSAEEVRANAQTYIEQFSLIVDSQRTEVRWQSEWFGEFSLEDVFQLTSRFTLAQMMQHETFRRRYEEGLPLSLMELLYPLLQAYDSVAIRADVEFGGTDQKFNILAGRELQSSLGLEPQQVLLAPLLLGTDGRKMSKSFGNTIDLTAPAKDMYGKVMSLADEVMMDYFFNVTDVPTEELGEMQRAWEHDETHPMELKKRLAREIVGQFYDAQATAEAEAEFERVFQEGRAPSEMTRYDLVKETALVDLLHQSGLAPSKSQARRLIQQGAVKLDGERLDDPMSSLSPGDIPAEGGLLQVGKRRFLQLRSPPGAA
ncbi:MAG: tyrosine--tRNA ligase [Chloroflexia bacterium]|nr:tyrosine--tRNA ligase [Chloroflexia bacterium]